MLNTLGKAKFGDFETFEVLERTFERRKLKENSIHPTQPEEERGGDRGSEKFVFAHSEGDGRWHTGYLTFCTKY